MKRGTKTILPVKIAIDLDEVEKVEFVFVQGATRLLFEYPSDKAIRDGKNIDLIWDCDETMMFREGDVQMDTHIHLVGIDTNPETTPTKFKMSGTLFKEGELDCGD